jgi:hypothetical protein
MFALNFFLFSFLFFFTHKFTNYPTVLWLSAFDSLLEFQSWNEKSVDDGIRSNLGKNEFSGTKDR